MPAISPDEKLTRHLAVENAIGTHIMEGLPPDAATLSIMRRYEVGELTLDQFSAAMDDYASGLGREQVALAVAS